MYTQLLKEILLNMDYDETAIGDFSRYCRERFPDDSTHLRRIEKFEREYYTQSPIYWYTGDVGIYSILNRALRTLDVEASIKMGFFIRDLHRQIEQLYNEQRNGYGIQPFTVYRGQGLSITDFNQLCKTRGGLISFNNFLSTSKNREISLFFAESNQFNPDLVGVNFVLQINPTISSTPFASIEETSYFEVESEVLFAMHSVFRIVHIQSMGERDKLYSVELTLTSENDPQLQELTERISDSIQGGTGLQRLGALMIEMGQYNKAIEIYQNLLNATQSYEDEAGVSSVYNQLGAVYNRIGDFDQALNYYKKSLTMKNKFLFSNDPSLSPIYSNIGSVLRNQNQLDEALKYMTRALNIEREASPPNELRLASYHNNIGLVFMDKGRYSEALSNYEQALEIQQRCLPSNHPELATLYNNIGTIYNEWKEYSKALSYYERSLEIMQKSLPSGHPDLATAYNNIGSLYNELYDYEKALLFYERALNIMQRSLPANHPSLLDVYRNLVLTHSFLSSS
ncbi:hypothetical protein I4U23_015568 [Adineta vaga]|nr:hypothetical protein I4U23_015568 [Adineta vaga]